MSVLGHGHGQKTLPSSNLNHRRRSSTVSNNIINNSDSILNDQQWFAQTLFPSIFHIDQINCKDSNTQNINDNKYNIPFSFTKILKRWENVKSLIISDILLHHVEIYNSHTQEYQPNYASLAALSLYQSGADDDIIRKRVSQESTLLDPLPSLMMPKDSTSPFQTKLSTSNWHNSLGKGPMYYTDILLFFFNEISINGMDATIQSYFPRLLPGISSFHPLISLGAAVTSRIDLLAAQALAFCTYSYSEISPIKKSLKDKWEEATVLEILQDMREDKELDKISNSSNWGTMEWHKRMRKCTGAGLGRKLSDFVSTWITPNKNVRDAQSELSDALVLISSTTGRAFPRNMDFPLTMGLIAFDSLISILNILDEGYYHKGSKHYEENHDSEEDVDDETMVVLEDEKSFKSRALKQFLLLYLACYMSQGRPEPHPEILRLAYPSRRGSYASELDEHAYESSEYSDNGINERPSTPPIHERVLRDFTKSAKSLLDLALHNIRREGSEASKKSEDMMKDDKEKRTNSSSSTNTSDDTVLVNEEEEEVLEASDNDIPNEAYLPKDSETLNKEWDRLCGAPYGDICVLQACAAFRRIHTEDSLRAAKLMRSFVANNNWELRGTGNGFKEYFIVDGGISEGGPI